MLDAWYLWRLKLFLWCLTSTFSNQTSFYWSHCKHISRQRHFLHIPHTWFLITQNKILNLQIQSQTLPWGRVSLCWSRHHAGKMACAPAMSAIGMDEECSPSSATSLLPEVSSYRERKKERPSVILEKLAGLYLYFITQVLYVPEKFSLGSAQGNWIKPSAGPMTVKVSRGSKSVANSSETPLR